MKKPRFLFTLLLLFSGIASLQADADRILLDIGTGTLQENFSIELTYPNPVALSTAKLQFSDYNYQTFFLGKTFYIVRNLEISIKAQHAHAYSREDLHINETDSSTTTLLPKSDSEHPTINSFHIQLKHWLQFSDILSGGPISGFSFARHKLGGFNADAFTWDPLFNYWGPFVGVHTQIKIIDSLELQAQLLYEWRRYQTKKPYTRTATSSIAIANTLNFDNMKAQGTKATLALTTHITQTWDISLRGELSDLSQTDEHTFLVDTGGGPKPRLVKTKLNHRMWHLSITATYLF